ncbi:hypothetical protein NDN08_006374 [Rhodosorus marinus]|uniref:Uncharacterized protein n=1 Tax=Rhodosorus marinus TaxID=101924 RepID=A0AAV8UKY1_9RHOD|nr:hypothetical protein NDN08_006374 [Rhodosorus marinus]
MACGAPTPPKEVGNETPRDLSVVQDFCIHTGYVYNAIVPQLSQFRIQLNNYGQWIDAQTRFHDPQGSWIQLSNGGTKHLVNAPATPLEKSPLEPNSNRNYEIYLSEILSGSTKYLIDTHQGSDDSFLLQEFTMDTSGMETRVGCFRDDTMTKCQDGYQGYGGDLIDYKITVTYGFESYYTRGQEWRLKLSPEAVEMSVGSISSPFWMNSHIANISGKLEAVNDVIGSSILLNLQQELAKDHVQASIMDPVNDLIYEQLYFRFLGEARYTQGAASSSYPVENHVTSIPAFRSWFPDHVELLGVTNVGGGHGWTPTPTPYPSGPPPPGPTPVELPPLEWCFQVKYKSFTRARMLKLQSFHGPPPPVIDECPFNLQFSFTLHADSPIGTVHYWLVFWNENGNNKGFSTRWYSTTIDEAGFYSATINRQIQGLPFEQTYGKARIKARFVFNLPWDRSEVTTTLYNGTLLDYSGICAVPPNQSMF